MVVLTRFIVSPSSCEKPQMMVATSRQAPPRVSTMTRFSRLMCWNREVTTTPASVEKKVASRMGMKTSVGWAAPNCARYTMMLTGMRVRPLVLSTRNIIIGFEAVSFFGFRACICSMAFSPSGVAALSSPSILAARFIKMLPVTGWPLGMSGKSLLNTGESTRASASTTPPRSPTFITPSHSDSTPVSPKEISKAVFDELKVESIMAGNTSKSPHTTSFTAAMAKAMTKNAIQI